MSNEGGFRNAAIKGGHSGNSRGSSSSNGMRQVSGRASRPEGSNSSTSGKVKPNGIVEAGSQYGTTYCKPEPARFTNTGANQKGKVAVNGVVSHADGPTYTVNKSHVSMPNADKRPKESKTIAKNEPKLNISGNKTASEGSATEESGEGGPSTRAYVLKKGYEKSGKTDKTSHKIY